MGLPKKIDELVDALSSVKFSTELSDELKKHKASIDGREQYWDGQVNENSTVDEKRSVLSMMEEELRPVHQCFQEAKRRIGKNNKADTKSEAGESTDRD